MSAPEIDPAVAHLVDYVLIQKSIERPKLTPAQETRLSLRVYVWAVERSVDSDDGFTLYPSAADTMAAVREWGAAGWAL